MNADDESDLGKINLLEYIKTLKEHYVEMQSQLAVKDSIIKTQGEALVEVLKTEDHMGHDSKWITYNTSYLRKIARKAIKEVDEILKAEKYKQGSEG